MQSTRVNYVINNKLNLKNSFPAKRKGRKGKKNDPDREVRELRSRQVVPKIEPIAKNEAVARKKQPAAEQAGETKLTPKGRKPKADNRALPEEINETNSCLPKDSAIVASLNQYMLNPTEPKKFQWNMAKTRNFKKDGK